jgi:hypothetical protein
MIKLGLADKAVGRIAQMLGGPENPEIPAVPGEEDLGSGLPKVLSVEKYVMSGMGKDFSYEDFMSVSAEELMGEPALSVEEVLAYVKEYYQTDLENEIQETLDYGKQRYPDDKLDMDYLESAIRKGRIGESGNTYNWSWWGPTINFTILGPADPAIDGEPYAECILLVSTHGGGDVRGNYGIPQAFKLGSYGEEAPWYMYNLYIDIKTDKGKLIIDANDDEAYNFSVGQDEAGIFGEGENISYDDLERKLDWEEFGSRGIW